MLDKQSVGRMGEAEAARYLTNLGFRVVEQNFRCRLGEIDIIARDKEQLIFVEVRSRTSTSFASAEESITARKRHQVKKVARFYLANIIGKEINCRFDVITVRLDIDGKLQNISHYQGAF